MKNKYIIFRRESDLCWELIYIYLNEHNMQIYEHIADFYDKENEARYVVQLLNLNLEKLNKSEIKQ